MRLGLAVFLLYLVVCSTLAWAPYRSVERPMTRVLPPAYRGACRFRLSLRPPWPYCTSRPPPARSPAVSPTRHETAGRLGVRGVLVPFPAHGVRSPP